MNLEERLSQVDWQQVRASYETDKNLPELEAREVGQCIFGAISRWLEEDIENLDIAAVEQSFSAQLGGGEIRGYLDLVGRIKPNPKEKAYLPYAGHPIVIDWKTSAGDISSSLWKQRYVDSWQWRIYLSTLDPILSPAIFVYRGVSRNGGLRVVMIEEPEGMREAVSEHMSGVNAMLEGVRGLQVWPRSWPDACRKFGEDCPFLQDCLGGTMPRRSPLPRHHSYSSMTTFLYCPERYRRLTILKEDSPTDEAELPGDTNSIFGTAFHSGIANVYSQVFLGEK